MYVSTGFSFSPSHITDVEECVTHGYFRNENYALAVVCEGEGAGEALKVFAGCLEGESHLGTLKNASYPDDALSDILLSVRTEWKKRVPEGAICAVGAVFVSGGRMYAVSFGKMGILTLSDDDRVSPRVFADAPDDADATGSAGDTVVSDDSRLGGTVWRPLVTAMPDGVRGAMVLTGTLENVLSVGGKTEEFRRLAVGALEEKTTTEAKREITEYVSSLGVADGRSAGAVIFVPEA